MPSESNYSPVITLRRGVGVVMVCALAYVLLLGLLTVVSVGGSPLIGRVVPLQEMGGWGFSLERFREADHSGPVDILVLGPSQAYCTFDPRWISEQGYSSLNLGSMAQVPSHTLPLVRKYIDRLHPRLVILVLYQEVLGFEGLESFSDLAGNIKLDRCILEMAGQDPSVTRLNVVVGASIRQVFFPAAAVIQKDFPFVKYIAGGYTENNGLFKGIEYWNPIHVAMLPAQLEATRQVFRTLAARRIPCVMVSVPITPRARAHALNYDDNERIIGKLAAIDGVPYKDFNSSLALLPPADFSEELHLSPAGVVKTQAAVFDWIKTTGLMPSKTAR